ncbi:hypothetical protein C4D60_Mb11t01810 [Musa balbisiana]|uniref:Lysine-specific demethylase ELF6 n=1 Tax=Musa balbisiana TaxID=52838 RepID=A0A4S8J155_MUSBA|nr:hypothetical protein C4D60_Mb11t01810 [Musa balbisiana]
MSDSSEIPAWLKNLPLAPEYHPTETEFADPIAFISRVEREAAAFGICKVIPPLPRPSKKFVLANLNRSLSASPDHSNPPPSSPRFPAAVFTTRHQELGARRGRALPVQKQVWQSGEFYTLEQFEAKSKAFARSQLGGIKEVSPLLIETLFWKAASEKSIYVEYANDVPGSGFGVPEVPFRYYPHHRRKRKRGLNRGSIQEPRRMFPQAIGEREGMGGVGWKLSNSPWNLQVIARAPGSLTRFMPDEVPGVTSPMVYIGMLFSWFAWHVEDHELHSLNFLHLGSPKTWYAVPGDYAATLEEIVRVQGYGGNMDRLAALIMLGEKTTLLSPEVLVASGVPCCRLVQHPGEFVVTFPRAYHVGFSHGFNCGEAANFATPKWLMVAKDAAVRRAAMNYLPMLSHQQLLYMLSISFISSVPRELLSGARSSRLRDRKKEEREILVKKAFLDDMMNESNLLFVLLAKATISSAVLWEPEMLPATCLGTQVQQSSSVSSEAHGPTSGDLHGIKMECQSMGKDSLDYEGDACCTQDAHETTADLSGRSSHCALFSEANENACNNTEGIVDVDEIDLPFGLDVDSGSLACVACGILGYPFMAILQPSEKASRNIIAANSNESHPSLDISQNLNLPSCQPCSAKKLDSDECVGVEEQRNPDARSNSHEDTVNVSLVENRSAVKESLSDTTPDMIGGDVERSRFCHLIGPEKLSTVNSLPVNCASNEEDQQILSLMERQIHELRAQDKNDACVQAKRTHCNYLKIKALAISIAEEINIRFNCEDVPLVNASPSDLDLINVSIDDEGHEEDGNDWTSKLGLNLRYCAKLKKQSPSNQEHLTLSLGGIFSDPSPTAVSNLKWLSRKSRTPHKVVGVIQSKSQFDANNEKCELIDGSTNSITDSAKVTEVYRSLEPHKIGTMHHSLLIKGMLKESGSGNTIVKVDDRGDERRKCGSANKIISQMKDDTGDNLHTIPVLIAECPQMHQVNWVTLRVTTYSEAVPPVKLPASHESDVGYSERLEIHSDGLSCKEAVCEPVKSASKQPFVDPELSQGFEEAYRSQDKFCSSDKSEILADRLTLESGTSEAQQVSAVDTANLGDEFNGNREAACGTGRRPLHYSLENLEDSCRTSLSNDQFLCLSESLINSEIQLNNLSVQEPLGDDMVASPANSNRMPDISINDGSKMLQDILARTEHIADGANIIKSENYFAVNNLVVNNSEMPQKAHCADEMEAFVKADGKTAFNHSMKLAEILAISMPEGSVMQEVHSTELCVSADSSSLLNGAQPNYHNPARVDLIQYVRRRNKRKRQQEQSTGCQDTSVCFVRSPCEGLRPRNWLKTDVKADIFTLEKSSAIKERRRPGNLIVQREDKSKAFKCDIEGCFMSFQTRGELSLHKRDRCTIEGCGKRFSCHKYAVRHQCVHNDDRPLRCPWKGCNMTFKWAWARTEHVRVHTGERPYKCKFSGCGQTFRFVSDFSRHRRKTGHYATPSAG